MDLSGSKWYSYRLVIYSTDKSQPVKYLFLIFSLVPHPTHVSPRSNLDYEATRLQSIALMFDWSALHRQWITWTQNISQNHALAASRKCVTPPFACLLSSPSLLVCCGTVHLAQTIQQMFKFLRFLRMCWKTENQVILLVSFGKQNCCPDQGVY